MPTLISEIEIELSFNDRSNEIYDVEVFIDTNDGSVEIDSSTLYDNFNKYTIAKPI